MQELTAESTTSKLPGWVAAVSIVGILWNMFGVYQYAGTFTTRGQAAMTAGMSTDQAALYLSLPPWISIVFAVGVGGGLIGSLLLVLQRRLSTLFLTASLVGYALLFAGDTYYGVFAALPSQLAILGLVVLIAAVLFGTSRIAATRSLLR